MSPDQNRYDPQQEAEQKYEELSVHLDRLFNEITPDPNFTENDKESAIRDLKDTYRRYLGLLYEMPELDLPPLFLEKDGEKGISRETRDIYANAHSHMYENDITNVVKNVKNERFGHTVHEILSCMFGGKTTFVLRIKEELEKEGIGVDIYVASVLKENKITARGGLEGLREMPAKPFGNYHTVEQRFSEFKDILSTRSKVIIIDEFSFLPDPSDITIFLQLARQERKRVILLGLDTNYLGEKLSLLEDEEYRRVTQNGLISRKIRACRAFTHMDQLNGEQPDPRGVATVRYINIGTRENPFYVLDLGLGELVISKTMKYIHYRPGNAILAPILSEHIPSFSRIILDMKSFHSSIVKLQHRLTALLALRH